jgi:hypothetical protein
MKSEYDSEVMRFRQDLQSAGGIRKSGGRIENRLAAGGG